MKRDEPLTTLTRTSACSWISGFRPSTAGFLRPLLVLCFGCCCLLWLINASAATAGFNPYSGIVERNSFGLKPPVNPADLIKPPPPVVADIKLQGITTILGRKQVLMKVKVPAKPPEPARDQSFVFTEGQREGEVEVLEINPTDSSVKVNNAGTILALNMNDHGDKPTPGAATPAMGMPAGNLPGIPPPLPTSTGVPAPTSMNRANPSAGNPSVTAFGGGDSQNVSAFGSTTTATTTQKSIPTRTLRSGPIPSGANGEFQNISPEAQAILIEAQRPTSGDFDPLPKTAITPRDRLQPPSPPPQ